MITLWIWVGVVIVALFGFAALRGAPYVPTKRRPLEKAFDELYKITEDDTLIDIGSGDGLVLREAAKRGAKAIGYELNPILVLISKALSRNPRITIYLADFWRATLPAETTIIYTFGESRDIKRMYQKAEQTAWVHNKEIYFLSFGFKVPGKKPLKQDELFFLYRIKPLQRRRA
jgi:hypothetical protein